MSLASRILAWLLAAAIVILSIVPAAIRPVMVESHGIEHFAAFLLTGVAFGLVYPSKLSTVAVRLVLFCAAIELIQFWVPGRHARLSDFIVDATASCAGVALAYATQWLRARADPRWSA